MIGGKSIEELTEDFNIIDKLLHGERTYNYLEDKIMDLEADLEADLEVAEDTIQMYEDNHNDKSSQYDEFD